MATAINALRRGDGQRAAAIAREVLPETSANPHDLLVLSRILLQSGLDRAAEQPLRRARSLAPELPEGLVTEVQFLLAAGRGREVAGVLERAAGALPGEQRSLTLAICHSLAGRLTEAAALFQDALRRRPDDAETIRQAAAFSIRVLDLDGADRLVSRLLEPGLKAPPPDVAWARRARALGLMQSGTPSRLREARALIDENLKANPYSVEDQRSRAILLLTSTDRAEEGVRELERLHSLGLLTREDRFLLALAYVRNDDWGRGRDILVGLIQGKNPEPAHLATYTNLLIQRNELDEAERWLGGHHASPDAPAGVLVITEARANLLKARGREADLLALLEGLAKSQPGAAAGLLDRHGFAPQAESCYRAAAARESRDPASTLALAAFLGRTNRTAEALALCDATRRTAPPEAVITTGLSILGACGTPLEEQFGQVERWISEAMPQRPGSVPLQLSLAELRTQQGRFDRAESIYRQILAATPESTTAANNLAWLLSFHPGKDREALDLIDHAVELAGKDPSLLDTRATIRLNLGRVDQALTDLQAAISLSPNRPVLQFHLARTHHAAGRKAEARRALGRAEELGLKPEKVDPREREIFLRLRRELAVSRA